MPGARFKSFHLYLTGAIIGLVLFVFEMVFYYSKLSASDIALSAVPVVLLLYVAFKVYHENADDELM
jgi:hypothetical protein